VKDNKFYYYDEDNDLLEYIQTDDNYVAKYVNPFLTLLFPAGIKEYTIDKIIGFQLNGLNFLIEKSKECEKALISVDIEKICDMLEKCGAKISTNKNGNKVIGWNKD
jgi:hypothetical protein